MLKYSIVVPFHNEEENVTTLYDRLKAVMEQVGDTFELVFVDDGSRDRTYRFLEEIAAVDSRVLVIKLRRNFGQTSALAAGFDHAQGDFILAMDGDLQHNPDEIPSFLAKLEEGYDVVSGWRSQRGDNFIFRRIPSFIANRLMATQVRNMRVQGRTESAQRPSAEMPVLATWKVLRNIWAQGSAPYSDGKIQFGLPVRRNDAEQPKLQVTGGRLNLTSG